jgi:hypothetical protein
MARDGLSFSDAAALLDLVIGTQGTIDQLYDLEKLPRKMMEIERKYRLSHERGVDLAITESLSHIGAFLVKTNAVVKRFITFVGIDQYFLITKREDEYHFRYRVGANRSPQLTVKFQVAKGSNLVRGEINLDVRHESPERIRALMGVIARLSDSCELFSVQQSGNIWILDDADVGEVEVVIYKTDRIAPSKKIEGFVEIEPLNSKSVETVIKAIEKYETALGLAGFECKESIADLFRTEK